MPLPYVDGLGLPVLGLGTRGFQLLLCGAAAIYEQISSTCGGVEATQNIENNQSVTKLRLDFSPLILVPQRSLSGPSGSLKSFFSPYSSLSYILLILLASFAGYALRRHQDDPRFSLLEYLPQDTFYPV